MVVGWSLRRSFPGAFCGVFSDADRSRKTLVAKALSEQCGRWSEYVENILTKIYTSMCLTNGATHRWVGSGVVHSISVRSYYFSLGVRVSTMASRGHARWVLRVRPHLIN